ncbi:arginase family protein [Streptomonospora sp. PA3]|uniref:arginase family protein n=1 Tax=Streptomonospora sp. PA3 TaxID=2607326 RepID=UPI0012DD603B|nr:arginase family protein [Streptomonospora sp. PA3]MUL40683.1 arginase family protein [Streptomonospora sp. PA3]
MIWQRDVDLVVPLWQGGDDVRVAAGAGALARLVPTHAERLHIAVSEGPRRARDGVRNLDTLAQTTRRMRQRLDHRNPSRILTLGGDCACDLAAAQHLTRRHPDLTVYWVDAHGDLNTPAQSPSGLAHGMALRTLLGEGHPDLTDPAGPALRPDQIVLAGVRDLDPPERSYISANAVTAVEPARLADAPDHLTAGRRAGSPAYIHLDLDVCEPLEMPAVAVPTPGGPGVAAVARALAAVAAHHRIAGVAVTEYAPVIEHGEQRIADLLEALGLLERPAG